MKKKWKIVLLAGLLVGSLDILAALLNFYIQTGKDPLIVLKYIASAVFGKETAYSQENAMMPVWGLLFHFMIVYIWTIFFFLIYPRLRFLSQNRILTGIGYGIFIWLIMNRLVVPMSKAAVSSAFDWKSAITGVSILIAAIGIPLSFITYRFYHRKPAA